MYSGKTVSVVMSTYNEKDSIRQTIEDFYATGFVDEIIIVDNNAAKGTVEEVRKTKATLIHEPRQGYGYGFQAGLAAASGDFIVMCEPDGTFFACDLPKFLAYTDQCKSPDAFNMEVVLGTRTGTTMILSGANMGMFLKYGNYFVAKLIELLFIKHAPHLSDCGCTYRLLTRKAYNRLKPHFREMKSAFGLELTLLTLRSGLSLCEIPIRYGKRVGESSVTGSFYKAFSLGMYMIGLSFRHFFNDFVNPLSGKDDG